MEKLTARAPDKFVMTDEKPVSIFPGTSKLAVERLKPGEGAIIHFRIDAQTLQRLDRKASVQDPALFLWENVVRSAVESYFY